MLPKYSKSFEFLKVFLLFSWSFCKNQGVFSPLDSYENHLLTIAYNVYAKFDQNSNLEVSINFLGMSKVFAKTWHEWLLLKLERFIISWDILNIIKSLLDNRIQPVVLNCLCSIWLSVLTGTPSASSFGPYVFSKCTKGLFADV